MAGGHLPEPGLARECHEALLMGRKFPRIHQHDGAGVDAFGLGGGKSHTRRVFVQRLDFAPVHPDAAGDFDDFFVQHGRKNNVQVEQPGARLVANAQAVGKAGVHDQQRALPFALQQRVGGDGGAHFHRLDPAGGDGGVEGDAQDGFDPGDGGVAVAAGVLRQQLMGGQHAGGVARHDIGERAAAIDPELPFGRGHVGLRIASVSGQLDAVGRKPA